MEYRQGIDFEKAYSTGPSSSMSYIGFLCSKYPTYPDEIKSIALPSIDRKRTLLYELLKDNGYNTYVVSNCLFSRYYGYDKGIDLMIDKQPKTIWEKHKKISLYFKKQKSLPYVPSFFVWKTDYCISTYCHTITLCGNNSFSNFY